VGNFQSHRGSPISLRDWGGRGKGGTIRSEGRLQKGKVKIHITFARWEVGQGDSILQYFREGGGIRALTTFFALARGGGRMGW